MRIAFLVNGDSASAMAERARAFDHRLRDRFNIATAYRTSSRLGSIFAFLAFLVRSKPDVIYVFDLGYSGVGAGIAYCVITRAKLVIDTGDAIYELARSAGLRGPIGLALTWMLERSAHRLADAVVVRGTYHQALLAERGIDATVVQDGVDDSAFASPDPSVLRARLRLDRVLSVGVLGSLIWSDRLQIGYGWDLIEALRLLRGEAVRGVIIGSGSALPILRMRAEEYGLGEQIAFLDRIPFEDVPMYLAGIDVWLSTQTNDVPGNVRTTGKLPLYMAAGRYILASDVGEAALVLPPEMRIEYRGVVDREYPARLAERLRALAAHRTRLASGIHNAAVARSVFHYDVLAERIGAVLEAVAK